MEQLKKFVDHPDCVLYAADGSFASTVGTLSDRTDKASIVFENGVLHYTYCKDLGEARVLRYGGTEIPTQYRDLTFVVGHGHLATLGSTVGGMSEVSWYSMGSSGRYKLELKRLWDDVRDLQMTELGPAYLGRNGDKWYAALREFKDGPFKGVTTPCFVNGLLWYGSGDDDCWSIRKTDGHVSYSVLESDTACWLRSYGDACGEHLWLIKLKQEGHLICFGNRKAMGPHKEVGDIRVVTTNNRTALYYIARTREGYSVFCDEKWLKDYSSKVEPKIQVVQSYVAVSAMNTDGGLVVDTFLSNRIKTIFPNPEEKAPDADEIRLANFSNLPLFTVRRKKRWTIYGGRNRQAMAKSLSSKFWAMVLGLRQRGSREAREAEFIALNGKRVSKVRVRFH